MVKVFIPIKAIVRHMWKAHWIQHLKPVQYIHMEQALPLIYEHWVSI